MKEEIMGFFFGRGKNKEKKEEFEDQVEQSSDTESKAVECSECGAKNFITGNTDCEYCGSPLIFITDGETMPAAVIAANQNTVKKDSNLSQIADTYTVTTGYYTVGIDIPEGTCNITAVSGSGNLYSTDGGINEVFGLDPEDVSSFKGLKLQKDDILSISGKLTIKIVYKLIQEGFTGRTYDISGAIDISAGNYNAGSDFKAGVYNIVAVSGSGNLSTGDYEVNEVFGLDEEDVHEINNVYLPKGAELSLEGDMSVRLIPAVTK